ncbi:hypothetical protein WAZ07_16815 [Bacillus sp. FJAT-51639]|uniref:Uncharacterized protein n=1 Tax=Bacillus bruguierae TaxID=3127667 RepID=A0ABU8FJS9_9BACI
MFEQEVFLSILDKTEMAYICKKFKLNVTGFQRDMTNAPIKALVNAIKTALTNGMKKKRRNQKGDHLPYEDMLHQMAEETLNKHRYISELGFEEFIVRMEVCSDVKICEIFAIVYYQYFEEYQKNFIQMVENVRNNKYVFSGLSNQLDSTPLEKIYKVIRNQIVEDDTYTFLKNFENEILESNYKEEYLKINKSTLDEEATFRLLASSSKNMYLCILLSFLLKEERYKSEQYVPLIEVIVSKIYTKRLEENVKELKTLETEQIEFKKMNEILEKENENFIELLANLNVEYSSQKEELQNIHKYLKEIEDENSRLKKILEKNEPLQMFFLRLISENDFMIVTKDVEQFMNTPFEGVTISPSQFRKQLKRNDKNYLQNQIIFITRVSFSTGGDWYRFKQLLDEHQLRYEEIGQYDICSYIKEIIECLNRKEIFVYADEI